MREVSPTVVFRSKALALLLHLAKLGNSAAMGTQHRVRYKTY